MAPAAGPGPGPGQRALWSLSDRSFVRSISAVKRNFHGTGRWAGSRARPKSARVSAGPKFCPLNKRGQKDFPRHGPVGGTQGPVKERTGLCRIEMLSVY